LFERADERVSFGWLENKWDRKYDVEFDSVDPYQKTSEYNLFRYQAETIRKLAQKEPFVVIGRAADYILQQHRLVCSVNLQAPFEDCVKAIMERKFVDVKTAMRDIRRIDKERDAFYRTYTGREWNDPLNYDLCINSSKFSEQGCVDLIRTAASIKFDFKI
jgi:cytidylate kinase